MPRELNQLQPTYGRFRVVGKVQGINDDKAFNSGVTDKGDEWQSLRFKVQTSPTNTVWVELFGMVQEKVMAFKTVKGQSQRERKDFDWEDRYDLPEGFHMIGVRTFIEPEEENENRMKNENKHSFDAVDHIRDWVDDGDTVEIVGRIDYSIYKPENGEARTQRRLSIQYISKRPDIDFEAEDFEEVASWEQEIVYIDTVQDREKNKGEVQGYIVSKVKGEMDWLIANFTIDGEESPKMLENFPKRAKFGDLITINGEIVNSVTLSEEEEEVEDEFGSKTNKGLHRVIQNHVREFRQTGISRDKDTKEHLWKKKYYTEEQFMKSEAEVDYGDSSKKDPFANTDGDLPF